MSDLLIVWIVESSLPLMATAATFVFAIALVRLAVHSLRSIREDRATVQQTIHKKE